MGNPNKHTSKPSVTFYEKPYESNWESSQLLSKPMGNPIKTFQSQCVAHPKSFQDHLGIHPEPFSKPRKIAIKTVKNQWGIYQKAYKSCYRLYNSRLPIHF